MYSEENTSYIHPTAVVDDKSIIGKGVKIWHFSHIMYDAVIGDYCSIGQNVVISPNVHIGNGVKIQNNVSLYTGVICEDDVFIGPSVVFTNVINPRSTINRKNEFRKTLVGRGATLGANSTIICGNNIGDYAFVGAGAVITKNVPPFALVVGNPARQIGWMSESGHRLTFGPDNKAFCPQTDDVYELVNKSTLIKIT